MLSYCWNYSYKYMFFVNTYSYIHYDYFCFFSYYEFLHNNHKSIKNYARQFH